MLLFIIWHLVHLSFSYRCVLTYSLDFVINLQTRLFVKLFKTKYGYCKKLSVLLWL